MTETKRKRLTELLDRIASIVEGWRQSSGDQFRANEIAALLNEARELEQK